MVFIFSMRSLMEFENKIPKSYLFTKFLFLIFVGIKFGLGDKLVYIYIYIYIYIFCTNIMKLKSGLLVKVLSPSS